MVAARRPRTVAAVAARDASSSDASLAALEFGSAAIASSCAQQARRLQGKTWPCSHQTSRNEGTISELRSVGYLGMSSPMVMAASDPFSFLWLWPFRGLALGTAGRRGETR